MNREELQKALIVVESLPAYPVALRHVTNVLPIGKEVKNVDTDLMRTLAILTFMMGVTWAAEQQVQIDGAGK
jgi:hypothetical protein